MTQEQANRIFKSNYPNWEVRTLTDRRLLYNDCIEVLRENEYITEKQASNWGHPKFLESHKDKINCSSY